MVTKNLISEKEILSYDFQVLAGFPSLAMDFMEERIDLNKEFVRQVHGRFVHVWGSSVGGCFYYK